MKSIILTKDESKIREIYSDTITTRMKSLGIDVSQFYTEKDIDTNDFHDVEYVFSTWNMPVMTEKKIKEAFPSLKAVFYAAGTVKYFAEPFLNLGIKVFSADYANGKAVADYVSGQILLAAKGYYQAQQEYKHRHFEKARQIVYAHPGNYEANIGIIGTGKIGKSVIQNLKQYDLNIYACDPMLSPEDAQLLGCKKAEMDEIFSMCDVISNHLPDIPSTAQILNYSLFSLMKDNATFINTGRGRQVVEKDLIRVLKANRSLCAVLDVTAKEPLLPTSHLFLMKNVFLTPHIAGSTNREQQRMASYMVDAYEDYISGRQSPFEISSEMIERMT